MWSRATWCAQHGVQTRDRRRSDKSFLLPAQPTLELRPIPTWPCGPTAVAPQVLIFLTRDYLNSANCRRELLAAVAANKPLLLLRETDETHGGISLEMATDEVELLAQCRSGCK